MKIYRAQVVRGDGTVVKTRIYLNHQGPVSLREYWSNPRHGFKKVWEDPRIPQHNYVVKVDVVDIDDAAWVPQQKEVEQVISKIATAGPEELAIFNKAVERINNNIARREWALTK